MDLINPAFYVLISYFLIEIIDDQTLFCFQALGRAKTLCIFDDNFQNGNILMISFFVISIIFSVIFDIDL